MMTYNKIKSIKAKIFNDFEIKSKYESKNEIKYKYKKY